MLTMQPPTIHRQPNLTNWKFCSTQKTVPAASIIPSKTLLKLFNMAFSGKAADDSRAATPAEPEDNNNNDNLLVLELEEDDEEEDRVNDESKYDQDDELQELSDAKQEQVLGTLQQFVRQ